MTKLRLLRPLLLFCLLGLVLTHVRAQDKTISLSGTITDNRGAPLPGATIKIKGSENGVSSNASGAFTIIVPSAASRLSISYIGYETQEIALNGRIHLDVALQPAKDNLEEVVVVGYGTQKRKDITGSIASVKGDVIKNQPVTSVTAALQGRAAGVEVIENSGQPGASTPTIIIRGLSSLHQPAPLYIVDGVRVPGDNINIQDIATIDVLKDASAAAIYGSAAAGGVIVITTKKGTGAKPQVNFDSRYGITVPKLVPLVRKADYIKLENVINPTYFKGATQTDTLPDVDWVHT